MKVYYGSDPELKGLVNDPLSAYGSEFDPEASEGEQAPASDASQPEPVYTSHSYRRKGERVFVDVKKAKPVKVDGFSI